jgi:putative membrane protein
MLPRSAPRSTGPRANLDARPTGLLNREPAFIRSAPAGGERARAAGLEPLPIHPFEGVLVMKKYLVAGLSGLFALATTAAFAQGAAPNDAQIAGIVVAANTVDIDAGKFAEKQSKDKEVKQFAKQMVTDHTGVNKQATALVKKLKVKPEESDTSKSLKQGGEENIGKLKGLKGKDFDKAYIDNEVTYHQAVIDALDKTLIPNAKNPELKDLLVKVRPAFVAHLDHAKNIQQSMK